MYVIKGCFFERKIGKIDKQLTTINKWLEKQNNWKKKINLNIAHHIFYWRWIFN